MRSIAWIVAALLALPPQAASPRPSLFRNGPLDWEGDLSTRMMDGLTASPRTRSRAPAKDAARTGGAIRRRPKATRARSSRTARASPGCSASSIRGCPRAWSALETSPAARSRPRPRSFAPIRCAGRCSKEWRAKACCSSPGARRSATPSRSRTRIKPGAARGSRARDRPGGAVRAASRLRRIPRHRSHAVDRADTWSGNPAVGFTNQPHREWILQAGLSHGTPHPRIMRRRKRSRPPTGCARAPARARKSRGGRLRRRGADRVLRCAAAMGIDACLVSGAFAPEERPWEEPLYRNLFGLLGEFGAAESPA